MTERCVHVWRYRHIGLTRVRTCVYCGEMWAYSEDPEDRGWIQVKEAVE